MLRIVAILVLFCAGIGKPHAQTTLVKAFPENLLGVYAIDSARCIVHIASSVQQTNDRGLTWKTLISADPDYPGGFSLSIAGCQPMVISMYRSDLGKTYLDLLESADAGATWEAKTVESWRYLPTVYRTQLPVAVHRTPRDSVLLFYDATLFRLTGSVTGNPVDIIPLPDTAVNVAVRNDSVFLATPSGLYLSSDAGTTWNRRFSGIIHEFLISQNQRIVLRTDAVRLLRSDDAGITWDTIPRPIAVNPIRDEKRDIQVTMFDDGDTNRVCMATQSRISVDSFSLWGEGHGIIEYAAGERRWMKMKDSLSFVLYPSGWAHPTVCWAGRGTLLYLFDMKVDAPSEQLSGFDQSTYARRRIRLNWFELDDELWRQGQLERSHNGGPWQPIEVLSPPSSYLTTTYVDTTVMQDWSGSHVYQYRLVKQFTDGSTRIYQSPLISLSNDSVFLDLLNYILPPASTWMHYSDEDGKRHSLMLRSLTEVDALQTNILFRYMIDYVEEEDRQYSLFFLRDDYLLPKALRRFGEFDDRTWVLQVDKTKLGVSPPESRFVRIPRPGDVPPDSIAFDFYPMGTPYELYRREAVYSRNYGLVSSHWIVTNRTTGVVDTTHVLHLAYTTTEVTPPVSPERFQLAPPFPNPFRAGAASWMSATLRCESDAVVRVLVCDLHGRVVRALHEGFLPGGTHILTWDGRDSGGRSLSTGLYFCLFEYPGGTQSRSVFLLSAP